MVKAVAILALAGSALAAPSPLASEVRGGIHARQWSNCTKAAATIATVNDAKLPNPFVFSDGTNVTTKDDMLCRAQEILNAMQQYELGTLPPPPDKLTATLTGSNVAVSVTVGSKSISMSFAIKKGSSPAPGPAFITIGGASIPIPGTVGTINFDNDGFAQQNSGSSRGIGLFYNLFGSGHSAGALTAWAWGVGRIIDALEQIGDAKTGIDSTRLGTTGCSRNGKGAFFAGALNPRIALTVPQESGSGGAACWRISDDQKNAGANIQTAGEIVGENVWFSKNLNAYSTKTSTMPEDHHFLGALLVPRGAYVIENDIDWLGPVSTTGCMKAARLIYKAYGTSANMGFSLVGGHSHCAFPTAQQGPELTGFINYYLLKTGTQPADLERSSATANVADYAAWSASVPTLT